MLNKSIISFFLLLFATCSFAGNRGKEQPKYLWFDAEANFERFASKDSISYYLEKAKSVGFNQVVVDVYNPQIQISAESETKRSIFREKDKTKRSKKESAQHL